MGNSSILAVLPTTKRLALERLPSGNKIQSMRPSSMSKNSNKQVRLFLTGSFLRSPSIRLFCSFSSYRPQEAETFEAMGETRDSTTVKIPVAPLCQQRNQIVTLFELNTTQKVVESQSRARLSNFGGPNLWTSHLLPTPAQRHRGHHLNPALTSSSQRLPSKLRLTRSRSTNCSRFSSGAPAGKTS